MTYDPKRDPIALHPLYPLMQGVLRVLNSTAYYDSGRWVMDRDEVLTLVETAFKHKMERLDGDLLHDTGGLRLTKEQVSRIADALDDADSFYDLFDNDNDGRGEIIRRGIEALSQENEE